MINDLEVFCTIDGECEPVKIISRRGDWYKIMNENNRPSVVHRDYLYCNQGVDALLEIEES